MRISEKLQSLLRKTPAGDVFLSYHLNKYRTSGNAVDVNAADDLALLQNYSKCPVGTARCVNEIQSGELFDLQIVVPIYKVEKYLRECLDSIINQKTKYNVVIILVDDGSPDNCPEICDDYACRDARIKVIHKPNGGLSSARNEALKKIIARYVMFVDSDDVLEDGAIDILMDAAYLQNADIVQGSFRILKNGHLYEKVGCTSVGRIEYSKLTGYPCGKVFRNDLFGNFCFPDGFWFEDTADSFLIFPQSRCTWALSDAVYRYRVNYSGITSQANNSKKSLDTFWITKLLVEERRQLGYPIDLNYFRRLKRQIILNHMRLSSAPYNVKEAVFNLSVGFVLDAFPQTDGLAPLTKSDILFDKVIRDRNFKLFSKVAGWL